MKTRRETLEGFLSQNPNDSFSRYALALELEKEGRREDAIRNLEEVLARDPNLVATYYQLGRLLAMSGNVDRARDVYRRGLERAVAARDQRTTMELREALDALE
jgi:tetratricopeptide (TPR) repeat protein